MPADDNPYLLDSEKMIVGGQGVAPPDGVTVMNFLDPSVYRFVNQQRSGQVTEFVVHETVTRDWASTVRVLKPKSVDNPNGRGLGVHLIADSDGKIYQHGDLASDNLWHGLQHNPPSVGVETVNPYEPRLMPAGGPWTDVISDAPWASGGKYVVPTPAQSEAVSRTILWITDPACSGLAIPRTWRGLRDGVMAMGPFPSAAGLAPGIYAHHYFGHGDGSWLVLYSWLRIEAGLSEADARSEAIRLATGAHSSGVDVSGFVK